MLDLRLSLDSTKTFPQSAVVFDTSSFGNFLVKQYTARHRRKFKIFGLAPRNAVKLRASYCCFSVCADPLLTAVALNLPLVLGRMELFYHKAHLQNLRADFRDLDQHLASREEMVKLLAKLPEPGSVLDGSNQDEEAIDQARTRYTQWINQILWTSWISFKSYFSIRMGMKGSG